MKCAVLCCRNKWRSCCGKAFFKPEHPDPESSTVQPEKEPEINQPITCYKVICRNKSIKIRGCPPTKIDRIEEIKLETLGKPVGVSFGTYGLNYPDVKPLDENRAIQAYTTCLMAFGEIYITPEAEWDSLVLNRILYEGKQHFDKALLTMTEKAVQESAEDPGPITEKDISKTIEICENTMDLHIYDPFIIGTLTSEDNRIPSFYYGITKFMRKLTYCLLTVANHYILIWKNSGLYFVFDCYGRDKGLKRETKTGVAVLIGLTSLKAVNHLIVNLSELPYDEVYVLRKIKMMALFPCCRFDNIERRIRQSEFEVINDYHAILKGHIHIGQSCFKENRYKFSLAIAVTALIYSKIDPPPTWDGYVIDKIIVLANDYYNAWTKCNHHIELVVHDIPAEISMGRYNINSIVPMEACGTWRCLPNFKRSKLTIAIKEIFARSSNLIVQIADRSYALWKRGDFFYIFDPYKHECRGSKLQVRIASIHLCSSLNLLCCIFANQIVDLPSPSSFYIHSLKIISLKEKGQSKSINEKAPTCHCVFKESASDDVEVLSLNTSIGDLKCQQELDCVAAKYGFDPNMNNLDSPSFSQTQVVPNYDDLKKGSGTEDSEDEEEEEGEEEESESEASDSDGSSDDEEGDGKGKGKKRKKGKKGKKDKKGKKKDKGNKDKKEKNKKEKDKKEKDKKEKDKKDKEKKDKEKKDKAKKDKEKKDKEKKDKEKKDKEKNGKNKGGKDKDGDGKGDGSSGTSCDSEDSGDGDKEGDKSKDKGKGIGESDRGSLMEEEGEQSICDDEDRECRRGQPLDCLPNSYPGYSCDPHNMAVIGSESGSYESLCNLIKTGFKCADRILTMTPWSNYVVFKSKSSYLLYDGCTCNIDRFRHLDLSVGTAGLLCFTDLHHIIEHIMKGKRNKTDREIMCEKRHLDRIIDEICEKYGCNK